MKDYLVIFERAHDGAWGAHSPDIEGVFALGVTREEAESRITEALPAHLAYLRATGRPVPEPHTDAARVSAISGPPYGAAHGAGPGSRI